MYSETMDRLPMCRICLAENVRVCIVANRNLRKLYETLTSIPFITEDSRPMLACVFCFAKLKQCHRLLRHCLKAEELFAQKINDKYEPNPVVNEKHFEIFGGLVKSPIEQINVVDGIAVGEELPAVCEGPDDVIEPKEEHCNDDVADIPPHCPESDSEDDVPLITCKFEVEDEEVSKKKRRATETIQATAVREPKQDTRRTKQKDATTADQTTKDKSDSKVIRTTQKWTSKPGTYFKEPFICNRNSSTNVKKDYKCHICQRMYTQKQTLIIHIRTHTGEKPFKCDVCQRNFCRKQILKNHMRTHTGEKPFKCDVCQRNFYQKRILKNHMRTHTGEKPYKCDVCPRNFSKECNLTRHLRTHTGEKPYKCYLCKSNFNQSSHLKSHMRTHTGEKPYQCDICQRHFSQKNTLTTHIRRHTGEKPYHCDICQRNFSQQIHLTNHMHTHTGEKSYKCDICQRNFSQKCNLANHMHTHTGEKPYQCDICQRNFSEKGSLTRHSRTHW